MDDTARIIAGMRSRLSQLRHIADITYNPEIQAAVLQVAGEIETEIERLEATEHPVVLRLVETDRQESDGGNAEHGSDKSPVGVPHPVSRNPEHRRT